MRAPTSPASYRRSSPTVCCGSARPALTPSPDTAIPFACSCVLPPGDWGRFLRSWRSKIWTRPSSASSSTTSRRAQEHARRSRNTRLAAIHSFFRYVSFQEPAHAEQCRRILAIPSKRYERRLIEHLKPEEIDALLAAPDQGNLDRPAGPGPAAGGDPDGTEGVRTDRLAAQRRRPGHRCARPLRGKGQKRALHAAPSGSGRGPGKMVPRVSRRAGDPAFPSSRGGPLSRDAVERLVARHQQSAEVAARR